MTDINKNERRLNKDNIKIALVSFQNDVEKVPPIGLVYLATYIRDKCGIKNIKIIDKNFDRIEEKIEDFSPNIIGMGPMTIHYNDAADFAEKIKKTRNIPIIIGGVHISTLPDSMKPCFDVSVIGEGEETFTELVKLYLEKGELIKNDLKRIKGIAFIKKNELVKTRSRPELNLDTLPIPDFGFVNKDYFSEQEIPGANIFARRAFILTSRSCPYKCKFCSTSHFWGKLRLHSPRYTARLIKDSIEKYKASYIKILDDLFTINPKRLEVIRDELKKLNVFDKIIGMECQPRANLVTEELCQTMKSLKVKIVNFGFESGSERVLNWLKDGSVTVEMNRRAIVLCKKYDFLVYGSLMFGSPGEKIEDIKKTLNFIDFAIKNKADYIWSFISTPFPDTPFWDIALKRGKVSNNMDFRLLSHHNLDNPLLLDKEVGKEEFKKLFLIGRKKLRKLKLRMITNFFIANPFKTMLLFTKYPHYYFNRVITQIYKH